jgi:hypothetical protein
MWNVEAHIPFTRPENALDLGEKMEAEFGHRSFSGAGCGYRDIGWVVEDQEAANALEGKLHGFVAQLGDGDPIEIESYEDD